MEKKSISVSSNKQNLIQVILLLSRISVGAVFTFSGFVKAVDPQGSYIKFVDYFNAFGMQSFEPMALTLAFILSAAEFLTGIALLLNLKSKLFIWLALLFMAVFTPLTFYLALENPVTDCGCFGDAWILTNWETFWKNIIITIFTLLIFMFRKEMKEWYQIKLQYFTLLFFVLSIFIFQYYNNEHLPVIDFRPYKIGANIKEGMQMPAGKKADKFLVIYTLKHTKTGNTKEIDSEKYIEEKIWEDTLWQITKTSDPILVEEGYKPPIHDFEIISVEPEIISGFSEGEDITELVLNQEFSVLIVAYNLDKANKKQLYFINNLAKEIGKKEIKFYALTASLSDAIMNYREIYNPVFSFYNTDAITLKTIVRANPGLVLLKKGTIVMKWHGNDVPEKKEFLNYLK